MMTRILILYIFRLQIERVSKEVHETAAIRKVNVDEAMDNYTTLERGRQDDDPGLQVPLF